MSKEFPFQIVLDTLTAEEQLKALEAERAVLEAAVETTVLKSKDSFKQVVTLAHQMWTITNTMFRAMGISMSMQFKLAIQTTFSVISILTPLLTAAEVTPGMQVQAAIGLFNIGLAMAALAAAEQQELEVASKLSDINEGLGAINSLIGIMSFT